MGGRRDKVESDVERLAQGGEFHVKQPDETEAQASISSDEPSSVSTPDAPEAAAHEDVPASTEESAADSDGDADAADAEAGDAPGDARTADAPADPDAPTDEHPDTDRVEDASPQGADQDPVSIAYEAIGNDIVTAPPADGDVVSGEYADDVSGASPEDAPAQELAEAAPEEHPATAEPEAPAEPTSDESADDTRVTQEEESPIAQEDPADTVPDEDDSPIARELADLSARRKALEEAEVHLTGRTRVLTVSNQKGGVGKTTTTVNLAAALAERGARVLVIDLDPQGNASTALGVPHTSDIPSVYDVLIDEFPLADIIQVSPESPNLLCAPSTIHLAGAEIELVSQVAREHRLRVAVDDYLAKNPERLDFILIDCPPSLGLLTINAFTAAGELLIPIQCEYYALEGLSQLLGTVQMIQKHLNPRLQLSTIMLTMYDGRTRLAQQVADEVRAHFPKEVLDTIIPRSVRVSEAPSFGQSVLAYDGQSAGAIAYREAAVEMIRRDSASNERGA
jgi:chromosome partitioning protein